MKVSVIIPVYNERRTVRALLEKVKAVSLAKEIIIVDDGSRDGTRELLAGITGTGDGRNEIRTVFLDRNQGKGAAVAAGLRIFSGDPVIIQDADLEYDPEDYHRLIAPIRDGRAKVVYGSRILGRAPRSSLAFYLGGRLVTLCANILYGCRITDEPTCYKVFAAGVIRGMPLREKGFAFCPEVTALVRLAGHRIFEVPISYYPRRRREGKKIRPRDGIEAFRVLLRYRFRRAGGTGNRRV